MTAAFRNFILTLIIALVLLGYAAYNMIPDVEAAVFGGEESEEISKSEEASEEESHTPEVSGSVTPEPEENETLNCVFVTRNGSNAVCSVIYFEIDTTDKISLVCRIPTDLYLYDSLIPTEISELLGANDNDYILKKIAPLVGKDIDFYISSTPETYGVVAGIAEKAGSSLTVDLVYAIKYIDPDLISLIVPGETVPEEYYRTLSAGHTALTEDNAEIIVDSSSETQVGYSFQESMGVSVLTQTLAISAIGDNIEYLQRLYASFETNIPLSDILKYAEMFFSYSECSHKHITYPTVYDTTSTFSTSIKLPDWQNAIKQINEAFGD